MYVVIKTKADVTSIYDAFTSEEDALEVAFDLNDCCVDDCSYHVELSTVDLTIPF